MHHPIRYAVISSDARLIAVAGRRGLTHYNALSGRWKLFEAEKEEESIQVVGGMAWWSNVLIVACVEGGAYQVSQRKIVVVTISSPPLFFFGTDSIIRSRQTFNLS